MTSAYTAMLNDETSQRMTSRDHQLTEEFRKFHIKHPEVYDKLVVLARELNKRGQVAGIGTLWEVLRHDYLLQGLEVEVGLNNNHRSRYARFIMLTCKDLKGFFKVRELQHLGRI